MGYFKWELGRRGQKRGNSYQTHSIKSLSQPKFNPLERLQTFILAKLNKILNQQQQQPTASCFDYEKKTRVCGSLLSYL